MKTPTHAAIGWLISRHPWWPKHLPQSGVVAGSIAPDLPIILAFAVIGVRSLLDDGEVSVLAAFRAAYASDPWLIASHQLLHAPISLGALYVAAVITVRLSPPSGRWAQSFLLGAMAHSIVDIFTHVDDGPLLLWPLDATLRLACPISHWDVTHCASLCLFLETIICLLAAHKAMLLRHSLRIQIPFERND